MLADPHYQARGLFEEMPVEGQDTTIRIPAILPKLSGTPGRTDWAGAGVGTHTDEVLSAAGYSAGEIDALRKNGDI